MTASAKGLRDNAAALELLDRADREYLHDVASAYLDAPEESEEEEHLERAHYCACKRLGIGAMWHVEIVREALYEHETPDVSEDRP